MNLNRGISTTLAITIIVVLAIIVGGGILAYQYYYIPKVELPKTKIPEGQTTGWKTYTSTQADYLISYPDVATIDTSDPTCIWIQNGIGSIYINNGFISNSTRFTCGGTTGLGVTSVRTNENINISGQTYQAEGYVDSAHKQSFFSFTFTDKVVVTYGVNMVNYSPSVTSQQYNDAMNSIKEILGKLKSSAVPSAQLTIISPSGGEIFTEGKTYPIKWTGGAGDYNIYVICTPVVGDEGFVGPAKANDGIFQWTLKNFSDITSSAKCRLAFNYASSDFSLPTVAYSNYFTIVVLTAQTSDWKTYINTQYGFEIKYPSDYKSQEIQVDNITGLSINLPRGIVLAHEIDNSIININIPEDCMFNLSALEDKNFLSFIETKQINGINFYYYKNYLSQDKYLGAYCGMSSGCLSRDVYRTLYKGKCYEVSYDRGNRIYSRPDDYRNATQDEMKVPEVFNQILSTFKFTK